MTCKALNGFDAYTRDIGDIETSRVFGTLIEWGFVG